MAAREGNLAVLRSVRAHGAPLESMMCEETGETLLHIAAQQGSLEMLSLLLSRAAPPVTWLAATTHSGQAALHLAVAAGSEAAAAILLESQAEVNQRNAASE